MAISYYAEEVSFPAIKKRETSEWIRRVAEKHGKKCGDIAYIFWRHFYKHRYSFQQC